MKKPTSRARVKRFIKDISEHTPFVKMIFLLVVLWILFSTVIFIAENRIEGSEINSIGDALYWGVAAFTTAGIADKPVSDLAKIAGGLWLIVGSVLFFGTIVATVTTYFMKPLQRPHKKIIDTIEYNLEQLDDLTVDELDLLKETVDTLIAHVERLKKKSMNEQSSLN